MLANDNVPIACTLDGDRLASRLAELRRFTQDHLGWHQREGLVQRLRYDRSAEVELRRIVDLERACCAFLTFEVSVAPTAVHLTITAPANAAETAGWLFEQFLPVAVLSPSVAGCACFNAGSCS